jgi:hypothetical protein
LASLIGSTFLVRRSAQVIKISDARQHDLENLHVEIPREKLVVITGLSGSGKCSLAFDSLYGEGQRGYVKSFRLIRQYFDQMDESHATVREEQLLHAIAYTAGGAASLCFTERSVRSCRNFWANLLRDVACLTPFSSWFEFI